MRNSLLRYRRNRHSQNGEDGIIAELLRRLGIGSGWCCEFGAWDGKHLSNTYALIEQGWQGVFIEGDPGRCQELRKTAEAHNGRLIAVCAFVQPESGPGSLEDILSKTPAPLELDILSIDVDSCDYQIWRSLTGYRPKIVIIEIDSRFEPGIETVYSEAAHHTTSFTAMLRLGEEKGYILACHTGNMIFIRSDLADRAELSDSARRDPNRLFIYRSVTPRSPGQFFRKLRSKLDMRY